MKDNLPPGVTENMIPGNRPEDLAAERQLDRLWDTVDNFVKEHNLDVEGLENLESPASRLIQHVYEYGFSEGYTEGDSDAADRYEELAHEHREEMRALRDAYANRRCEVGPSLNARPRSAL